MKVVYKRHGGFAPMAVACTVDTDTCPPDDAKQLEHLVATSGIMQSPGRTVAGARDVRYHSVTVDQNGQHAEVTFDDISIPSEVRPLIDFLQSRAKNVFGDDED